VVGWVVAIVGVGELGALKGPISHYIALPMALRSFIALSKPIGAYVVLRSPVHLI